MAAILTYAIGDIHGNYTKLRNLLNHCMTHCGERPYRMVFVGDYVDRGRRSREVIEVLMRMQADTPEQIVCLKGNHEDMLVAAAKQGGRDEARWLLNGGDTTLGSYGVKTAAEIPPAHLDWIAALPLAIADERRFYVHAGIMPGVPLQEQSKEHTLWIREPFLSDTRDHGLFIVHGHTPSEARKVDLRPNRVNLDSGAAYGGPLSAAVFDEKTRGPKVFITDDGRMTTAPHLKDLEEA